MALMKLSESQEEFGEARLTVLAEILKISEADLVTVLLNIDKINHFYSWVNADIFLQTRIHKK